MSETVLDHPPQDTERTLIQGLDFEEVVQDDHLYKHAVARMAKVSVGTHLLLKEEGVYRLVYLWRSIPLKKGKIRWV